MQWFPIADQRPLNPVIAIAGLAHRYRKTVALADVSLSVKGGGFVGIIGPDGVGKSTLLGLIAGAKRIQSGEVAVLAGDMREQSHRSRVCPRIAYMPQGLGKNLYPDLSVRENIDFFARLFGEGRANRERRIAALLAATGLAPFPDRSAKKLSGGMRQKLGLCCALVHDPDLLILDEPTTGVDPLSRRQFWDLIEGMRRERPELTILVATAYMDEAERFDTLIAMNAGRILATGTPSEIKERTGKETLEESFIALLPETLTAGWTPLIMPPRPPADHEPAIVARDLTRRFGDFVAVDRASFTIERGEIFGFLGSNGCGKTTTMKMLTGLLPASAGSAALFGQSVEAGNMDLRRRVGYMSQSFSLYTELTVRQNLDLHARLFHLPPGKARARIGELVGRFGLAPYLHERAAALPLGIRQRLSLAVAVVHEPELLILDEPTSGVDPLARDSFWELLVDLSRNQGVTIFVSTHFMSEALRCDRISLMNAGKVLATGTPASLVAARNAATLEEAFISYLEAAIGDGAGARPPPGNRVASGEKREDRRRKEKEKSSLGFSLLATLHSFLFTRLSRSAAAASAAHSAHPTAGFSFRRMLACSLREALEFWRDPVRLGFAFLGSVFLMAVFGFGINTDVDTISFAVLDRDNTPESRAYLEAFRGSPYFVEHAPLAGDTDREERLRGAQISVALEMPPGFGRDLRRGDKPEVGAWVDGAMPFHAETTRGYVTGVHQQFLADLARSSPTSNAAPPAASVETRFRYNQDFKSIYAMVPGTIAMLLAFMPAMLMAVAVVREKELGSITNLYVTPLSRLEFLLGKQLPYVVASYLSFVSLFAMAVGLFHVPFHGGLLTLAGGALLYVIAMTGYGLVVSVFTRTQMAALFAAGILTSVPAVQFSGLLSPVSSLTGFPAFMAHTFPAMYFLRITVGTFTKSLGFAALAGSLASLALFIPLLTGFSLLFLRKQER